MESNKGYEYRSHQMHLVNLSNFARAYREQLIGISKICALKEIYFDYKESRSKLPLSERKNLGAEI